MHNVYKPKVTSIFSEDCKFPYYLLPKTLQNMLCHVMTVSFGFLNKKMTIFPKI